MKLTRLVYFRGFCGGAVPVSTTPGSVAAFNREPLLRVRVSAAGELPKAQESMQKDDLSFESSRSFMGDSLDSML